MNKYYYRAEIYFGDKSAVYGEKHNNFDECVPQLTHFISSYAGNIVTCAKIQKYHRDNNQPIVVANRC